MNHIQTISAIVMFAVVLGVSSLAPALAKADTTICHFTETEYLTDPDTGAIITDPDTGDPIVSEAAHWQVITVNNKGATNGHIGHHGPVDADSNPVLDANGEPLTDFEIDETEGSGKTSVDCLALPTE